LKTYYSLMTENREANIYIYGDITSWPYLESDVSSYNLAKQIDGLDVDVINVYLNSYGGEVPEGWAIYNSLKRHKARIKTHDDGFAASIVSVIFMAGVERIMSDLSLLFVHNAWTYVAGNASELRKTADDLETMSQMSKKAYMEHVNITEEELDNLLAAESYITPQDALTMGFATAIVSDNISKKPSQSVKKKVMNHLIKMVETPKETLDRQEPKQEPDMNSMKNFLAGLKSC
jgi:ATP-dependent Clp protease protease subunit